MEDNEEDARRPTDDPKPSPQVTTKLTETAEEEAERIRHYGDSPYEIEDH
jgi:hypothetical protein